MVVCTYSHLQNIEKTVEKLQVLSVTRENVKCQKMVKDLNQDRRIENLEKVCKKKL